MFAFNPLCSESNCKDIWFIQEKLIQVSDSLTISIIVMCLNAFHYICIHVLLTAIHFAIKKSEFWKVDKIYHVTLLSVVLIFFFCNFQLNSSSCISTENGQLELRKFMLSKINLHADHSTTISAYVPELNVNISFQLKI